MVSEDEHEVHGLTTEDDILYDKLMNQRNTDLWKSSIGSTNVPIDDNEYLWHTEQFSDLLPIGQDGDMMDEEELMNSALDHLLEID